MLFHVWAFLEIFHFTSFYPFKSFSFCRFVTLLSNWNSVPAKYAKMSKKYLEKCHFTIKYCEILPFNLCAQFGLPQNPNFKLVIKWRNIKPPPTASSPLHHACCATKLAQLFSPMGGGSTKLQLDSVKLVQCP